MAFSNSSVRQELVILELVELLQHRLGNRVLGVGLAGLRATSRLSLKRPAVAGRDDAIDLLLQFDDAEVAAVLDDDLEAAGRAEAGHRRRREQRHLGLGDLLGRAAALTRSVTANGVHRSGRGACRTRRA